MACSAPCQETNQENSITTGKVATLAHLNGRHGGQCVADASMSALKLISITVDVALLFASGGLPPPISSPTWVKGHRQNTLLSESTTTETMSPPTVSGLQKKNSGATNARQLERH